MSDNGQRSGLDAELNEAIDDLQRALQQAAGATLSIRALLPRVAAVTSLFEEIDSTLRTGRQQLDAVAPTPLPYARPTLLASSAVRPAPTMANAADSTPAYDTFPQQEAFAEPSIADASFDGAVVQAEAVVTDAPTSHRLGAPGNITCFRLEFESRPGPLDLRVVDDAVGEHPAVRDVALLDYDGRKATLKVWIDGSSSPAGVQQALIERAPKIFTPGNEVSIVAIEDAA